MKTVLIRSFVISTFLFFIHFSFGQAGTLDSSFGLNGKVTTAVGADYYGSRCTALKQDGKFVSVGNTWDFPNPNKLVIAQYLSNGNLDSSFGNNGIAFTSFNFGVSIFIASSLVIQPDNKIIVGGGIYHDFVMTEYFVLIRYQANGKIDSSFGTNGIVFTYIGPYPKENFLSALYLQNDGKILAGGHSDGFCLIRYSQDGLVDSSFAENGIFTNRDEDGFITDIAVQPDGKIIIVGGTRQYLWGDENLFNADFKIMRLRPQGIIDSSFGVYGVTRTDFLNNFDQISSCKLLLDGNILVNGAAYNGDQEIWYSVFAKYRNNGHLDSTFATGGKLISQTKGDYSGYGRLLIQPDEKFLSTGIVNGSEFYVSRYNANGLQDLSFGTNGKATANFETSVTSYSAILQSDGKIIVGGGPDFKFARFKGDAPITVSIKKNISVTEGNTGTTPAQFIVVLDKPATTDVFVNYTTKNLNAIAGSDYTTASGTVRIKAGKVKANIVVNVIGDNTREANERFSLVLSNPINAVLGTLDSVICTIKNDDPSFAKSTEGSDIKIATTKIYPNPVKDVLNIQGLSTQEKVQLSIVDVNGKVVAKKSVSNSSYTWNIKTLPAGSYFILIQSQDKYETLSFVKQ